MLWLRVVFRPRSRCKLAALIALSLCFQAREAMATAFALFGFGPEGVAEVSARGAAASDGTATFYNPGGLAFGHGCRIDITGMAALSTLETQGNRVSIEDPVAGTLAVASDVPLQGPLAGRVHVGVGVYALPGKLMRLRTRTEATPFFPYYDNRTQRLTVIPALSIRLLQQLGVGVGVNVLAGVAGPIDVREGQSRALESRIVQEAGTVAALVAGLRFDPHERLHAGLTFRQKFGVPLSVTTTANVAGVPLVVDVSTADAQFDPTTWVAALRVDASDSLSLEVDTTYQRWSAWSGPLLRIDTTVSALSLSTKPPEGLLQDTFGLRVAAAWHLVHGAPQDVVLHAGLGYESSLIDDSAQQGRSNLMDGAKVLAGLGASTRFPGVIGKALRVGMGLQLQRLLDFEQDKVACAQVPCPAGTVAGPDTSNPGENIDNPGYPHLGGGGAVLVASFGLGVEL